MCSHELTFASRNRVRDPTQPCQHVHGGGAAFVILFRSLLPGQDLYGLNDQKKRSTAIQLVHLLTEDVPNYSCRPTVVLLFYYSSLASLPEEENEK